MLKNMADNKVCGWHAFIIVFGIPVMLSFSNNAGLKRSVVCGQKYHKNIS
jgi:hypothetical protein